MTIPDVTIDTLEELANGKRCPECARKKPYSYPKLPHSVDCGGTGRIEPDLRMIDAMVNRATDLPSVFFEGQWYFNLIENMGFGCVKNKTIGGIKVPHYTTDWSTGGPLLKEVSAPYSYASDTVFTSEGRFHRYSIWHWDKLKPKLVVQIKHESELIARVSIWLLWKDMIH